MVAPCINVNVVAVTVVGFNALLNVALKRLATNTFVAPLTGTVEITVGGVVSAVVKLQTYGAVSAIPAGSWAPVLIVAVSSVFDGRRLVGVKTAVEPL